MASTVDWLIFGLAPLVALWIMSQERILNHVEEVRANWTEQRCNPLQMPFASIIQPEVGASGNFNHCMGAMSKQVLKLPLDTIQHILGQFTGLMKNVAEKLNIFRDLRQRIGLTMMSMMTMTMGKMAGLVSVLVGNLHKIRDLIRRIIGTGTLASQFAQTVFMFVKTLWNLAISILQAFVIAMLAIAVVLAISQPLILAVAIAIAALFASAGGFSKL